MGKAYIFWDEIPDDLECPECGSRVFKVIGFFKAEFEALIHFEEGSYEIDDGDVLNEEWRVIDGIECAKCGRDLSDLVGL